MGADCFVGVVRLAFRQSCPEDGVELAVWKLWAAISGPDRRLDLLKGSAFIHNKWKVKPATEFWVQYPPTWKRANALPISQSLACYFAAVELLYLNKNRAC